jgi:hypothetical protein
MRSLEMIAPLLMWFGGFVMGFSTALLLFPSV